MWPIRVLKMPDMNLGFSSFRVCGLRLKTRTHRILLLAMFRFGSSLLHLMMMLKARCEPRFWACKFRWNFLCTLQVCASNFCWDSLFENLLVTLVIACRKSLLCESLLRERLVVAWLLSGSVSLSSVVCALMLHELNYLLFLCIIARQPWLFMCIVVGQIGTYVNRNQWR